MAGTPKSFTFRALKTQQLSWTLTDQSNLPITGATVKASLFSGRSRQAPSVAPGTVDAVFNNITLVETPALSGVYIGSIPEAFSPAPTVLGFVTVITAAIGATQLGDWEIPTVVLPGENVIDLVLLDDVKNWLGMSIDNTDCDGVIQLLISSFSQFVLNYTGINSFNSIQTYTEIYDGNGAPRMFLRNYPVLSLTSVNIGSYSVPFSSTIQTPGVFIEASSKSIAFRSSGTALMVPRSIYPYRFSQGIGNIQVSYTSGYTQVPFDLGEACMKAIAINHKRKDWIDLASKSLAVQGTTGTTRYRDWALPPEIMSVLDFYSRYAIV